jgi:hypothetical protein
MEKQVVEKSGRKKCITERNGRSCLEQQGTVAFCTCQWSERINSFNLDVAMSADEVNESAGD